jgi:predicted metal-dependent phosphoesterase TrpH
MPSSITVNTRFEPGEDKTWRHIPFDVPQGVHQFHISVSYNERIGSSPMLSGGNCLDVGLFDILGTESGGPGLRGWSGSERTEITIDETWATPPYRSGTIGAGTWNLLVGAYKVSPSGLDVTATITFNTDHVPPEAPPVPDLRDLRRAPLPKPAQPGWYRGDLHMHTVYSDGDSYPHEVAAVAYQIGLDFYGITDHNRAQSPVGLVPQGDGWPVLVPGVEVTTYAGHFNVWGTDGWYDFRNPTAEGIQAAVDAARADGGLLSLNHPKPFGPPWEFPEVTGFDAIEAWNGWWGRLNNLSIGYWADELNRGSAGSWPVGLGGSDAHKNRTRGSAANPLSEATMGYPTLWIQTDQPLTPESILDAIRAGRCFISESPSGPQIYVRTDGDEIHARIVGAKGDALLAIGPHGCVVAEAISGADACFSWPTDDLRESDADYVRFEIHTPTGGIRALSNPVWF